MYTHIIKKPPKRTPSPSLHKDSDLGVPTSPLRLHLRGSIKVLLGGQNEVGLLSVRNTIGFIRSVAFVDFQYEISAPYHIIISQL